MLLPGYRQKSLKEQLMKYMNLFIAIFCINQLLFGLSDSDRAPRLDAPPVTSPISVVVPALDLGAVLQVLASINCKIGNVNQDVCENTILSVLGDACSILGISISEAIALLLECCETDSFDFNGVFTVLQDIQNTLTECCSTMTQDFQFTWTILADLNDTITDCCSTMTADFQFTWTILADLKDTVTDCCADLRANFCDPIFIHQSDFDPAGTTPYVISSPGVYKLAEDITYNPAAGGTSAITIASSNVILDLQCFMLQQGNGTLNTTGITVNTGLNDFEIKNGHIENFRNAGVAIASACSRFKLSDFVCINIGVNGIALNGLPSPAAPNIVQGMLQNLQVLQSSTLLNDASSGTFFLQGCADLVISDCQFNRNDSALGVATVHNVVYIDNDLRCSLENIQINDNTTTIPLVGMAILNSSFCTFTRIDIINNTTRSIIEAANFIGINITLSSNLEFYSCRVLGQQYPGTINGIAANALCSDLLFSQCEVSNNTTTGIAVVIRGFDFIVNQRITVKDCIVRNNTAPNSNIALPNFGALGYTINSSNSLFQNNIAEDQDTGASSNSVGFLISGGTNNVIQDCESYRQDFGFRLDPALSVAHVFLRNIAAKNTTNFSQFPVGSNQNAADISAINGSLTVPWTNAGVN